MEKIELELTEECAGAMRQLAESLGITESILIEGMFLKHLAEKSAEFAVNGPSPQIYLEYTKSNGKPVRGKALYEMLLGTFTHRLRASQIG